jgi:hypothetical protein
LLRGVAALLRLVGDVNFGKRDSTISSNLESY